MKIFRVRSNHGEMTAYVLRHNGADCVRYWAVEQDSHILYRKQIGVLKPVGFGSFGKSVGLDRDDLLQRVASSLRQEARNDARKS